MSGRDLWAKMIAEAANPQMTTAAANPLPGIVRSNGSRPSNPGPSSNARASNPRMTTAAANLPPGIVRSNGSRPSNPGPSPNTRAPSREIPNATPNVPSRDYERGKAGIRPNVPTSEEGLLGSPPSHEFQPRTSGATQPTGSGQPIPTIQKSGLSVNSRNVSNPPRNMDLNFFMNVPPPNIERMGPRFAAPPPPQNFDSSGNGSRINVPSRSSELGSVSQGTSALSAPGREFPMRAGPSSQPNKAARDLDSRAELPPRILDLDRMKLPNPQMKITPDMESRVGSVSRETIPELRSHHPIITPAGSQAGRVWVSPLHNFNPVAPGHNVTERDVNEDRTSTTPSSRMDEGRPKFIPQISGQSSVPEKPDRPPQIRPPPADDPPFPVSRPISRLNVQNAPKNRDDRRPPVEPLRGSGPLDATAQIEEMVKAIPATIVGLSCIQEREQQEGPIGYECTCCGEIFTGNDVVPHVLSMHHRRYFLQSAHPELVRMRTMERGTFDVDLVAEAVQSQFGTGKIQRIRQNEDLRVVDQQQQQQPQHPQPQQQQPRNQNAIFEANVQPGDPSTSSLPFQRRPSTEGNMGNKSEDGHGDQPQRQRPPRPPGGSVFALNEDALELLKLEEIELGKLRDIEREIEHARHRPFDPQSYENLKNKAQNSMEKMRKIDRGKRLLQSQNSERLMAEVKELVETLSSIERERESSLRNNSLSQELKEFLRVREYKIKCRLEEIEMRKKQFDNALDGNLSNEKNVAPHERVSELPPTRVTEMPPTRVTEMPPTQVTEMPPTRVIKTPPTRVTEMPPIRVNEMPPIRVNEMPPTRVNEVPQSRSNEGPQSRFNEMPQPRLNRGPQSSIDEGPPPRFYEVPQRHTTAVSQPRVVEMPPTDSDVVKNTREISQPKLIEVSRERESNSKGAESKNGAATSSSRERENPLAANDLRRRIIGGSRWTGLNIDKLDPNGEIRNADAIVVSSSDGVGVANQSVKTPSQTKTDNRIPSREQQEYEKMLHQLAVEAQTVKSGSQPALGNLHVPQINRPVIASSGGEIAYGITSNNLLSGNNLRSQSSDVILVKEIGHSHTASESVEKGRSKSKSRSRSTSRSNDRSRRSHSRRRSRSRSRRSTSRDERRSTSKDSPPYRSRSSRERKRRDLPESPRSPRTSSETKWGPISKSPRSRRDVSVESQKYKPARESKTPRSRRGDSVDRQRVTSSEADTKWGPAKESKSPRSRRGDSVDRQRETSSEADKKWAPAKESKSPRSKRDVIDEKKWGTSTNVGRLSAEAEKKWGPLDREKSKWGLHIEKLEAFKNAKKDKKLKNSDEEERDDEEGSEEELDSKKEERGFFLKESKETAWTVAANAPRPIKKGKKERERAGKEDEAKRSLREEERGSEAMLLESGEASLNEVYQGTSSRSLRKEDEAAKKKRRENDAKERGEEEKERKKDDLATWFPSEAETSRSSTLSTPTSTLPTPTSTLPTFERASVLSDKMRTMTGLVGKRMGGKSLKTGIVPKAKKTTPVSSADDDYMSQYMREVHKFTEKNVEKLGHVNSLRTTR